MLHTRKHQIVLVILLNSPQSVAETATVKGEHEMNQGTSARSSVQLKIRNFKTRLTTIKCLLLLLMQPGSFKL